jgi:hypothetical protein
LDLDFEGLWDFSEGLATVSYNDKMGCIDKQGRLAIPLEFEELHPFSDGLAAFKVGDKYGYIDKTGAVVIAPQYKQVYDFQSGYAKVRPDLKTAGVFIDKQGNQVLKKYVGLVSRFSEGLINCQEKDNWGYMDITGALTIAPQYAYARPFFEGKGAVRVWVDPNDRVLGLFGFLNKSGEMVIPPLCEGLDIQFSEDRCAVLSKNKGKYGFIDPLGNLVIDYRFNTVEHFSDGLSVIQYEEDGKYGYVDKNGDVAIEPIFDQAESFEHGLAEVYVSDGGEELLRGYIDKNGDYVWGPKKE